ncbi:MAG: hypothetical protein HQ523_06375 [Lentisphaerae bacterium]|nr:hypothetical protein [Lentisphaerota bacterium]
MKRYQHIYIGLAAVLVAPTVHADDFVTSALAAMDSQSARNSPGIIADAQTDARRQCNQLSTLTSAQIRDFLRGQLTQARQIRAAIDNAKAEYAVKMSELAAATEAWESDPAQQQLQAADDGVRQARNAVAQAEEDLVTQQALADSADSHLEAYRTFLNPAVAAQNAVNALHRENASYEPHEGLYWIAWGSRQVERNNAQIVKLEAEQQALIDQLVAAIDQADGDPPEPNYHAAYAAAARLANAIQLIPQKKEMIAARKEDLLKAFGDRNRAEWRAKSNSLYLRLAQLRNELKGILDHLLTLEAKRLYLKTLISNVMPCIESHNQTPTPAPPAANDPPPWDK